MKYKVGDRVRIKSLDWYNENRNDDWGSIELLNGNFYPSMAKYCGEVLTIIGIKNGIYLTKEGDSFNWTDEMIEGLVEEEIREVTDKHYWEMLGGENNNEINLPEGYIFKDENGNVINAKKIVLEKKEARYPKTYEESCEVLGYSGNYNMILTTDVDNKLFNALYRLKVCRDAYWKLFGEEMGLGKPWEPDWEYDDTKYVLFFNKNEICHEMMRHTSYVLAFPTEEMRDAFKENFDPDIEICKELL